MAGMELVRLVDDAARTRVAQEIQAVTRSRGGVDRVAIDASKLNFDPRNPVEAIAPYGEVLGPRYVEITKTPLSDTPGLIDLREGVKAPGDGVKWTLQFRSAETGEPLTNGKVGAWMTAPSGYRGIDEAAYYPDAFRGYTTLGEDGRLTILAHDPQPYQYPAGSGNWLEPHIHGYLKGADGHVDMPWEQLRANADDLDDVAWDIVVPRGEGRMTFAAWDDHANAVHAPTGHPDAGFVLPSEPPPLG